jgi:putative photosynthetic complex assembly protein 2
MTDLLQSTAVPALFALLAWWFGTGAVLWLVRRPAAGFRWRMAAMSVLGALSLWTTWRSMQSTDAWAAYLGFASVIVMWGWHEMAFLSGWIAGTRRVPLTPGAQGRARFNESLQVVSHHEMALLLNFGLLWVMQQGAPNHVALCTYALLWCMRLSAKLNLFFGVPEVGAQYLPAHLAYLGSYFRRGRVGLFFWFSIAAASGSWLWLVAQARAGAVELTPGWVLLATLLGLAIVEHLLMVFPLPMQKLWGWALGQHATRAARRGAIPGGLPGAPPGALPAAPAATGEPH